MDYLSGRASEDQLFEFGSDFEKFKNGGAPFEASAATVVTAFGLIESSVLAGEVVFSLRKSSFELGTGSLVTDTAVVAETPDKSFGDD